MSTEMSEREKEVRDYIGQLAKFGPLSYEADIHRADLLSIIDQWRTELEQAKTDNARLRTSLTEFKILCDRLKLELEQAKQGLCGTCESSKFCVPPFQYKIKFIVIACTGFSERGKE